MNGEINEAVTTAQSRRESYRALRRQMLAQVDNAVKRKAPTYYDDEPGPAHPLQDLRRRVLAMRELLSTSHGDEDRGLIEPPSDEVRRALGIPSDVRLSFPLSKRLLQNTAGAFMPTHLMVTNARRQLRQVGTFHGRRLLYAAVLRRYFPSGRALYFTESLDFALRHLEGKVTHEQLETLQWRNVHWLRAFYKVGVHDIHSMLQSMQRLEKTEGPFVEMLVDERIIQTRAELSAWPKPSWSVSERVPAHYLVDARAIVRTLVERGVPRATIARICALDHPKFQLARLKANLVILDQHQVDVPTVADGVGKFIWATEPRRWRFLTDVLHLRAAEDLALFEELLKSGGEPNTELAQALLRLHATPRDLAACQRVLLLETDTKENSILVRALGQLTQPPFSFQLSDFGKIREFARNDTNLEAFLGHLARHQLVAAKEVLAFENCYHWVTPDRFGSLLDVGAPRRGTASTEELAKWILAAARIGRASAYEEAAKLLKLCNLAELRKLLTVASLGESVLRYLILDKTLRPLDRLIKWFHNDAQNVLEVSLHGPLGDIERTALDDAFARKRFGVVNHNAASARSAAGARATTSLGPRPDYLDQSACASYDRQHAQLRQLQESAMADQLRRVLARTGGVALPSLLNVSAEEFNARMAVVTPVLSELMLGRGPAAAQLATLEIEAIALVYGVDPRSIEELWPQLVGHEKDLAHLTLNKSYPMRWQQAQRDIANGEQLDAKGLAAIGRLPGLVEAFNAHWTSDMDAACQNLRAKRLRLEATDVNGFEHHLAVLCAIASKDHQVAAALGHWQASRDGFQAGSVSLAELESLNTFFNTVLPDALEVQMPVRLLEIDANAAATLLQRLGTSGPPGTEPEPDRLVKAVAAVKNRVLPVYVKWIARERRKFPKCKRDAHTELHAVVSKSPAAYFAKKAVGLCTALDVAMWKEDRHSHLVVFDASQKCLAGLALLYVERIKAVDPLRPTLVIRAMTPTARYAAQHDAASLVEAFFSTAIQVAAQNDLAAVAFPEDNGMHLVSNNTEIQNHVLKRYVRRASGLSGARSSHAPTGLLQRAMGFHVPFDCYAIGGSAKVEVVYVMWRNAKSVESASV